VKKIAVRLTISLLIAALLVWWIKSEGLSIIPSWKDLAAVQWWAVPLYVFSLLLVHFFRAYRVGYLLKPLGDVGLRKLLLVNFAGFFAIMLLPLRTGEFARPYLFKKEAGISMSAGMGTVAIERIVDGVIVSLWLTIALFTVPSSRSGYIWTLRSLPLALFAGSLVFLVALILWTQRLRRVVDRLFGFFGRRFHDFALHVFDGFLSGLKSLPQKSMILGFTFYTLVYWGFNALGVWALARGCGLDIGAAGAIAVVGVLAVGIMLPTGPGYFGNFQASVLIALSLFLADPVIKVQGAVFIFILFVAQGGVHVLAGIAGLLDSHTSLRGLITRPESMEEWKEVP
jgi:uncharacterized protein (TIRG00374 family)